MDHVRISKKGRDLMNNPPLAHKVVKEIIKNKENIFIDGKTITVSHNGVSVKVSSATSISMEK